MPTIIVTMCVFLATGVFGAIALSLWGTCSSSNRAPSRRQGIATEFVWALIPCLMIVAAAIPAASAMISAGE